MNQSKTDNSIAKIKTSLETMNRINDIEKQINDLEGRVMEITQSEQQISGKKKRKAIYEICGIKQSKSVYM